MTRIKITLTVDETVIAVHEKDFILSPNPTPVWSWINSVFKQIKKTLTERI